MSGYLLGRLGQIVLVVFAAISVNFALIHLAPGDPTYMILGRHAQQEDRDRVGAELGLDRPLVVQYADYITDVMRGQLGNSYRFKRPVIEIVMGRVPATLRLAGTSFVLSLMVGIFLGALTATRAFTWFDTLVNALAVVGFSLPIFWVGIVLILFFSLRLGVLPVHGMVDVRESYTGVQHLLDVGKHLILPLTALMLQSTGSYVRLMRSSMLEVLNEDYIRTGRAKGLKELIVTYKHAVPNASLAVITLMGVRMGYLFTSTLMVEIVFAWPGTGRLFYDAVFARDYPLLLGTFFIVALMVAGANLLADIVYAVADPRIRLG